MHEFGIAESILKSVVARAEAAGAGKVTGIRMKLGEAEMLTREAMQATFDTVAAGSIAAGAVLAIEFIPGHDVIVDEIEVETD